MADCAACNYLSAENDDEVILTVYVQPRASRDRIVGPHEAALKIAITAPPVDGKANQALTAFLAKFFGISKRAVSLKSGGQGRTKKFALYGISLAEAHAALAAGRWKTD